MTRMRSPWASSTPSTLDKKTTTSALTSGATIAASWSLSPKRSSSVATVSFSFDNRHRPRLEQGRKRAPGVVDARAIGQVRMSQEHLRRDQADAAERGLVAMHQHALAGSSRSLQLTGVLRTLAIAQTLPAERDGPARNDDHPTLAFRNARDLVRKPPGQRGVIPQRRRPDLHDHSAGCA